MSKKSGVTPVSGASCADHIARVRFVPKTTGNISTDIYADNFSPSGSPGWNCSYSSLKIASIQFKDASTNAPIALPANTKLSSFSYSISMSGGGCSTMATSGTWPSSSIPDGICSANAAQTPTFNISINGVIKFCY